MIVISALREERLILALSMMPVPRPVFTPMMPMIASSVDASGTGTTARVCF